MGLSPKRGEVQQLTIEVPGPVRGDQWKQYKQDVESALRKYSTIKAKIVEVVYLSRKGKRVKPDGLKRKRRKRRR